MIHKASQKVVAGKEGATFQSPTKQVIDRQADKPRTRHSHRQADPSYQQIRQNNLARKHIDAASRKPQSHVKGAEGKSIGERGGETKPGKASSGLGMAARSVSGSRESQHS